jgi:hypothetical protein
MVRTVCTTPAGDHCRIPRKTLNALGLLQGLDLALAVTFCQLWELSEVNNEVPYLIHTKRSHTVTALLHCDRAPTL